MSMPRMVQRCPPPPRGKKTPLLVVCLSAPVLHANYVAQFLFLFFNQPQAGSALPLAFCPVIHPKDVDTLPIPAPMADNGTSISNATMPIRDACPLREAARWRSCAR